MIKKEEKQKNMAAIFKPSCSWECYDALYIAHVLCSCHHHTPGKGLKFPTSGIFKGKIAPMWIKKKNQNLNMCCDFVQTIS